jgi:hypothetical protein
MLMHADEEVSIIWDSGIIGSGDRVYDAVQTPARRQATIGGATALRSASRSGC